MDVPGSNCVVCFDFTPHVVSLVQRRGRGRDYGSKFVMLAERADRTTRDLEQMEKVQQRVCADFKMPDQLTPEQLQKERDQEHTKQMSRERAAGENLRHSVAHADTITIQNALSILNVACKQTKVDLVECAVAGGMVLKYESTTRSCEGQGYGARKKAKREAAVILVHMLCEQLGT